MRIGREGLGGAELLPQGGVRRKRNLTGSSLIEGGRVKQWAAVISSFGPRQPLFVETPLREPLLLGVSKPDGRA